MLGNTGSRTECEKCMFIARRFVLDKYCLIRKHLIKNTVLYSSGLSFVAVETGGGEWETEPPGCVTF